MKWNKILHIDFKIRNFPKFYDGIFFFIGNLKKNAAGPS